MSSVCIGLYSETNCREAPTSGVGAPTSVVGVNKDHKGIKKTALKTSAVPKHKKQEEAKKLILKDPSLWNRARSKFPRSDYLFVEEKTWEDEPIDPRLLPLYERVVRCFRQQYRRQWNQPHLREVLAWCPHVMMWSDEDVCTGFNRISGGVAGGPGWGRGAAAGAPAAKTVEDLAAEVTQSSALARTTSGTRNRARVNVRGSKAFSRRTGTILRSTCTLARAT